MHTPNALSSLRTTLLILVVTLLSSVPAKLQGQDAENTDSGEMLIQPRLQLAGPNKQEVTVLIEYCDNGNASAVYQTRVPMAGEGESNVVTEELEFGHEGIRVLVLVPTKEPVRIQLKDGDRIVESRQSAKPRVLEIRSGDSPSKPIEAPRFLPDASERELLNKLFALFGNGSDAASRQAVLQELVSPDPTSNVDWATVDAWVTATTNKLGTASSLADSNLDGWQSLQGNLGARLLTGILPLEKEAIRVSVSFLRGKIVDVEMDSYGQLEDWFQGPTLLEPYRVSAEEMLKLALQNKPEEAHALFGRLYKQQVPVDSMIKWTGKLQDDLGRLEELEFTESTFDAEMPDGGQGTLRLVYSGRTRNKNAYGESRQITGQVSFIFDTKRDEISRGSLANVDVRETWPSACPELAELTSNLIRELRTRGDFDRDSFHPRVSEFLNWEALQKQLHGVQQRLAELPNEPQFDRWRANYERESGFAEGKLLSGDSELNARFEFWEGKLIGFRIEASDWACSSFTALKPLPDLRASATRFWALLLAKNWKEAHQMLPEGFQLQVPYSEFETMMEENSESSPPVKVQWDYAVFETDSARPAPLMVSCYQTASLGDGTQVNLLASYRWSEEGWELVNFDNGFTRRIVNPPSEDLFEITSSLVEALNAGNAEELIALLGSHRTGAYPEVTTAFMQQLHQNVGQIELVGDSKSVHSYDEGVRYDWELGTVQVNDAGTIPLHVKTQNGELRAFQLFTAEITGFEASATLLGRVETLTDEFLHAWFAEDPAIGVGHFLVPALRSPESSVELADLRRQLVTRGQQHWKISDVQFDAERQLVTGKVEFQRSNRTKAVLELDFRVDAFTARIAAIRLVN